MSEALERLLNLTGNSIEISGPADRATFPHKTAAVKVFDSSGYTTYERIK